MNDAPIYNYQELVIEEMRKELISQDQYIGKLTEAYNIEIERLNNIINELEKDINKRIERYDVDETINGIVIGTLKYVLDKLQELKGSDKE